MRLAHGSGSDGSIAGMYFQHSAAMWAAHPYLRAGAAFADGVSVDADVDARIDEYASTARSRLDGGTESELPEIQAWRRTYAAMGFKPTQYRCAAEALLRRFRKDGELPRLHPVVDLCNAISLAYAVPIAVFDISRVEAGLEVRHADGDEDYLTFGGQTERPAVGEVVFADAAHRAHARRWTNRQSGLSAVRVSTTGVLVVAEAVHDGAGAHIEELVGVLTAELARAWPVVPTYALLSEGSPRFDYATG